MEIVAGLLIIIALGILGWWLLKDYFGGRPSSTGLLGGREKRVSVIERATVDGRRKLLLVRRDNVEHLIMTGGPIDVVIETGIHRGQVHHPQTPGEPVRLGERGDGEAVTFARPRSHSPRS